MEPPKTQNPNAGEFLVSTWMAATWCYKKTDVMEVPNPPQHVRCCQCSFRPRLAGLHFTSEAIFFFFNSMNSSTGGAEAVLVNRLAK